eukprot:17192-Ditylum_brightwellii.AAC.1
MASLTTAFRKKKDQLKWKKNNVLFNKSHKWFYSSIHSTQHVANHNKVASGLEVKKESPEHVPETSWINVEDGKLLTVVKSLKNWSAPSLDQDHNYW